MLSSEKPVIYEVDELLTDLPKDTVEIWARETAELLPWLLPRYDNGIHTFTG
jgi:hypothetical protein